nr:unnamed protein product [Callosobruchus chinensis]
MPRNELSAFDRTRINYCLWQEGLSRHQIANRLNNVRSTVSRTIRRYEETGEVNSRLRTGRPTVSTRRDGRYIAQLARRERSVTVLRSQYQRTFNWVISTATNRRRVLASGLRCRRPLRVPLLTTRYRTARLQWARAHQDWLLPQWRNVLFSDESRFELGSDDYRERVWRERGGQNRLATAIGFAPYRGGTQIFWGGIRFNGRTQLIHIPGTMTGAYYLQNIINAIVQPLRNQIGDHFIFMDDNAIEHVWDYVSRAIFNRNNLPRSTQELIVAATEEWDNITQDVIDNLIIGMHRRVDALIRSRGGNTKSEFIITFILFLFSLKILFLHFQIIQCQF